VNVLRTHTRRRFAAGGAAAVSAVPWARYTAGAAEFEWKWAFDMGTEHPICVRTIAAFGNVYKDSGGRLRIRAYANSALGSAQNVMSQVRLGAIEMFAIPNAILDSLVPSSALESVPYAFPSREVAFAAMDGDLGALVRGELEPKQLYAFPRIWENGWREFTTSSRQIRSADDLDGLKLRASPSKFRLDIFKSLGASGTPVAAAEIYTALQTRLVDGQDAPLIADESLRLFEVQKYCSLTHHAWGGYWHLLNTAKWRSLPPALQDSLGKRLEQAVMLQRRDMTALYRSLPDLLHRQGLTFNEPSPASFKAKLVASGFYSRWRTEFGAPWTLLEKYSGRLG
jgi:tripartite ATP-independent transporter DctP family solute receptor